MLERLRCGARARRGARLAATLLALVAGLGGHVATADVLYDDTRTVAIGVTPVERTVTAAQSGPHVVTVTDVGFPAPLSALRVAVTQGATLVKPGLTASGTITFDAQAGTTYTVRVLGRPDPAKFAGAVSVDVAPSGGASILSFVATFQLPGAAGPATVDRELTIPATGQYTFLLQDHAFPAAFTGSGGLSAVVFYGSQLVGQLLPGQPLVVPNVQKSSPSDVTHYKMTVVASPGAGGLGLWGLTVSGGPANAVVLDETNAVGALPAPTPVAVPGGALTLDVADFAFPAPLATVGAVLTQGGRRVGAPQLGTGTTSIAAVTGGTLQLWRVAQAGATSGSYRLAVTAAGASSPLYADAQTVSAGSTADGSYVFPLTLTAAGTYQANVVDLGFPSPLATVQVAVVQNGAVLQSANGAGTLTFTAAAGPAAVLVVAQPPAGGSGLFDVRVTDAGANPVLEQAQGVGGAFDLRTIPVVTAGRYDVSLADGRWPAAFQSLSVALVRDGQVVGKIYGGGTFAVDATPGRYLAAFVATPSATEQAGLYSLTVQPSVPTATLSADRTSVSSGQTVKLTWSSTAASTCTAGGDWSGTKSAAGGSETSAALTKLATFTLTCTGPGGTSTAASVTVNVTAAESSGGGGGGAFGLLGTLLLVLVPAARLTRHRHEALKSDASA
jgi:plastocyanin